MQWFKDIQAILNQEPENWLAYLHGQQLDNLPHLTRTKPRFRGIFFTLLKFAYFNFRHLSIHLRKNPIGKADFFIFAGTENQINSLESTAESLIKKRTTVTGSANKKLLNSDLRRNLYQPFRLSLSDVAKSFFLLSLRSPRIYHLIKNNYSDVSDWCLNDFLRAYPYLSYFHKILKKTKPKYILVSNDHNVSNRSLLAVAHQLDIKTVYLQHASVSNIFPALRVDYAFLDGQCALETYQDCEKNQPNANRNLPSPTVILSGQKKTLSRKAEKKSAVVGFALNALDNIAEAIKLTNQLASFGYEICVRWHPGQARTEAQVLQDSLESNEKISFSDPSAEPVGNFLGKVSWLISGNSSIHLEAALAGVLPIYFELTPPDTPDYYGYAKHGLAKHAASTNDILQLLTEAKQCHQPNINAVRYYSATYLSKWDGKEGGLVAECLVRILKSKELPVKTLDLFPDKSKDQEQRIFQKATA